MSCLGSPFLAQHLTSTSINESALTVTVNGLVHEFAHRLCQDTQQPGRRETPEAPDC
jgi:hypothetical protein